LLLEAGDASAAFYSGPWHLGQFGHGRDDGGLLSRRGRLAHRRSTL